MITTAQGTWFYGIGSSLVFWGGKRGFELKLTTGLGRTEYDGKPCIADPIGALRGHEYYIVIFGHSFRILNRVFGSAKLREVA